MWPNAPESEPYSYRLSQIPSPYSGRLSKVGHLVDRRRRHDLTGAQCPEPSGEARCVRSHGALGGEHGRVGERREISAAVVEGVGRRTERHRHRIGRPLVGLIDQALVPVAGEDPAAQHLGDRPTGDLFDDQAEQQVVGADVLPLVLTDRASLGCDGGEPLLGVQTRNGSVVRRFHELVFIDEVLGNPAAHREQVFDRRPVGVELQVGRKAIGGEIVEGQLARLDQLHHLGRHQGLGDAGDGHLIVRDHRSLRGGHAGRAAPGPLRCDQRRREPVAIGRRLQHLLQLGRQLVGDGLVTEAGEHRGREDVRPRTRRGRGRCDDGSSETEGSPRRPSAVPLEVDAHRRQRDHEAEGREPAEVTYSSRFLPPSVLVAVTGRVELDGVHDRRRCLHHVARSATPERRSRWPGSVSPIPRGGRAGTGASGCPDQRLSPPADVVAAQHLDADVQTLAPGASATSICRAGIPPTLTATGAVDLEVGVGPDAPGQRLGVGGSRALLAARRDRQRVAPRSTRRSSSNSSSR